MSLKALSGIGCVKAEVITLSNVYIMHRVNREKGLLMGYDTRCPFIITNTSFDWNFIKGNTILLLIYLIFSKIK